MIILTAWSAGIDTLTKQIKLTMCAASKCLEQLIRYSLAVSYGGYYPPSNLIGQGGLSLSANMENNSSGMFNETLACIKWTNINLSFTPSWLKCDLHPIKLSRRETIRIWTWIGIFSVFSCVLLQLWAMDCRGNCARVAAAAQLEAVRLLDISGLFILFFFYLFFFFGSSFSNRKDEPRCDI